MSKKKTESKCTCAAYEFSNGYPCRVDPDCPEHGKFARALQWVWSLDEAELESVVNECAKVLAMRKKPR